MNKEGITPSLEEYLTAIYKRGGSERWTRTTDIAADLHMTPASVTEAFKKLAEMGYIEYIPYRGVRLTERGSLIAEPIVRKELAIRQVLIAMGVREEEADRLACTLEHIASEDAVNKMIEFTRRCAGVRYDQQG